MSRLSVPAEADLSPQAALLLSHIEEARGQVFNIYRALSVSGPGLEAVYQFADAMWTKTGIPVATQEVAILRTALMSGSRYEWARHFPIAIRAGLSDEQLRALTYAKVPSEQFDSFDLAVIQLVDEINTLPGATAETIERLREHVEDPQVLELVLLAGFYLMVSKVLATLDVQVEADSEPLPAFPRELN